MSPKTPVNAEPYGYARYATIEALSNSEWTAITHIAYELGGVEPTDKDVCDGIFEIIHEAVNRMDVSCDYDTVRFVLNEDRVSISLDIIIIMATNHRIPQSVLINSVDDYENRVLADQFFLIRQQRSEMKLDPKEVEPENLQS